LTLYSKRAIARERGETADSYTASLERFEKGLKLLCDHEVSLKVDIEPEFQPLLHAWGRDLNFPQIPDGIRYTVGWLADFMMRADMANWDPRVIGTRPGLLLLDELDAHLHPRWQRRLLPSMR